MEGDEIKKVNLYWPYKMCIFLFGVFIVSCVVSSGESTLHSPAFYIGLMLTLWSLWLFLRSVDYILVSADEVCVRLTPFRLLKSPKSKISIFYRGRFSDNSDGVSFGDKIILKVEPNQLRRDLFQKSPHIKIIESSDGFVKTIEYEAAFSKTYWCTKD